MNRLETGPVKNKEQSILRDFHCEGR